jgi:SAM-dependent methyltransferase
MHSAITQSEQYLDLLLEYLACPVDNSVSLTAIRNHDGAVVALRSKDTEYPVINNVPCMIPDLGEHRDGSRTLWQDLQSAAWQDYQSGHEEVFSAKDHPLGHGVGRIISQTTSGLFLDVGCGPLPWPGYMASSNDRVSWIGVDPYFGDLARRFPFAQALGEHLPFRPQVFDGVLYAGVIDHVIDPLRSLQRARTIVKPEGKLFIWYDLRQVDLRYVVWRAMRGLGLAWRYNENHQWAFTHRTLRALLKSAGFVTEEVISLCDNYCPNYPDCQERAEFLAVASCL